MSAVKFSVVIPTRERADTLRFALRTCLDQTFDDYEVIVSDNFSSPATKAVVDEVGSPKVRYVRTVEPIAMSANWEFGVSHARGEYVLLIGDDDGLLPHALRELDVLSREPHAKAIRWSAAYYTWPDFGFEGQGNYLCVPMGCARYERDGAEAIREVAAFREFYTELPMLYNAAVHRDLLGELRRRTGRVFPHPIPDVYTGFAVAHAAGRYLSTSIPMTVSGQSGASNGIATLFNRGRSAIDREFFALNARAGLRSEPTVPDLPVYPQVPVADTFAFAKRVLFPELPVELDRRELARACVAGARVSEADWPAALTAVRASLVDAPELVAWFDAELAGTAYRAPAPPQFRPAHLGFDGCALHLDAGALGAHDVAAVSRLCDQVLGYRNRAVKYNGYDDQHTVIERMSELVAVSADRQRTIVEVDRIATDLRAQIDTLTGWCHEHDATIARLERENRELNDALVAEMKWSLKRPFRVANRAFKLTD